ncbi:hypothetical protein [Adonisia turfae]|nr:hypothetical protein [Adonisia turfae]
MMSLTASRLTKSVWRIWLTLLALLSIPLSVRAQPDPTPEDNPQVPYRLLVPLLQPYPLFGETVQLHIGNDVPDLPTELPVPTAGVHQWTMVTAPYHLLFFEVDGEYSQVESDYLEDLQHAGWERWMTPELEPGLEITDTEDSATTGALVISITFGRPSEPLPESENQQIFCKQGSDIQLSFNTFQSSLDTTKLRVTLISTQSGFACNSEKDSWSESESTLSLESDIPDFLPELSLSPPNDAQLEFLDSNGGNNYLDTQTKIQTTLSLGALTAHYSTQMRQQGWSLQSRSGNDRLQWSVWSQSVDSELPQQATVYLFATEEPEHYIGMFGRRRSSQQDFWPDLVTDNIPDGEIPESTALGILKDMGQLSDSEEIELWLNQLPPAFSDNLPVPPETFVLGGTSDVVKDIAILETSLHPGLISDFYRESLTEDDWQIRENVQLPSFNFGFESSRFYSWFPQLFCHSNGVDELILQIRPVQKEASTIYLERHAIGSLSPCSSEDQFYVERGRLSDIWGDLNLPIPTLQTPSKTFVQSLGSGGSATNFDSNVHISSQLTTDELAEHYLGQMHQAGWQQQAVAQSDKSLVSVWTFTDDSGVLWRAWLTLIAQTETNQWHGSLSAFTENRDVQHIEEPALDFSE